MPADLSPGDAAVGAPMFTVDSDGPDIQIDCSACDETIFEMEAPVDLDVMTRRVNDHYFEVHDAG